ncbi:MAG: recombinase family protein [Roseovarius pacificus]|nr:recombinase family protein [Roseovarius pacificus]
MTRKFNSLDAQHEACAAYVMSQRGEGWVLTPARYDDGGVSGGTLERPGLQRLMEDVDAGRIDMVVVYKIDRLTRSLADFAKLVDRFEAAGCSFVSVTQAFNTSSSMGRLTLNMLLSFAQFEREVTAERIRDKIAASKKRGLWMGGVPPMGYDAHPDPNTRSLVINEAERGTVETLFALYDDLGCLRAVEQEAARQNLRSKRHVFSTGRVQGGGPLSRGQIHHILCNPIYAGKIRHKDKVFEGQHAAIIDGDLWARVQARLAGGQCPPQNTEQRDRGAANPGPRRAACRNVPRSNRGSPDTVTQQEGGASPALLPVQPPAFRERSHRLALAGGAVRGRGGAGDCGSCRARGRASCAADRPGCRGRGGAAREGR